MPVEKPSRQELSSLFIEKSASLVSRDDLWESWKSLNTLIQVIWSESMSSAMAYQLVSEANRLTALLEYIWFEVPLPSNFSFVDYRLVNAELMSEGIYFPEISHEQQVQNWLNGAVRSLQESLKTSAEFRFLNGTGREFFLLLRGLMTLILQETTATEETSVH